MIHAAGALDVLNDAVEITQNASGSILKNEIDDQQPFSSTREVEEEEEKEEDDKQSSTSGALSDVTTSQDQEFAMSSGLREGRWTPREHELFLEGYRQFGRSWKDIATVVFTRTPEQIRTHAQKYFGKTRTLSESSSGSGGDHHASSVTAAAAAANNSSSSKLMKVETNQSQLSLPQHYHALQTIVSWSSTSTTTTPEGNDSSLIAYGGYNRETTTPQYYGHQHNPSPHGDGGSLNSSGGGGGGALDILIQELENNDDSNDGTESDDSGDEEEEEDNKAAYGSGGGSYRSPLERMKESAARMVNGTIDRQASGVSHAGCNPITVVRPRKEKQQHQRVDDSSDSEEDDDDSSYEPAEERRRVRTSRGNSREEQLSKQRSHQTTTTSPSSFSRSSGGTSGGLDLLYDKTTPREGRWSKEEHSLFLEGYRRYGKVWKEIATLVTTRTPEQIRTHHQKWQQREAKRLTHAVRSVDSEVRRQNKGVKRSGSHFQSGGGGPSSGDDDDVTPVRPKRQRKLHPSLEKMLESGKDDEGKRREYMATTSEDTDDDWIPTRPSYTHVKESVSV